MIKRTSEEREKITENDVLQKLKALGPELQLEYLDNLNKRKEMPPALKVVVCKKLAELYERKSLYSNAALVLKHATDNMELPKDKKEIFLKIGILRIKLAEYEMAEDAFKRALTNVKSNEKQQLQQQIKKIYIEQGGEFEGRGKIARASEIYERVLRMAEPGENLDIIKMRLSELYRKLGRIGESINLRNSVKGKSY